MKLSLALASILIVSPIVAADEHVSFLIHRLYSTFLIISYAHIYLIVVYCPFTNTLQRPHLRSPHDIDDQAYVARKRDGEGPDPGENEAHHSHYDGDHNHGSHRGGYSYGNGRGGGHGHGHYGHENYHNNAGIHLL